MQSCHAQAGRTAQKRAASGACAGIGSPLASDSDTLDNILPNPVAAVVAGAGPKRRAASPSRHSSSTWPLHFQHRWIISPPRKMQYKAQAHDLSGKGQNLKPRRCNSCSSH